MKEKLDLLFLALGLHEGAFLLDDVVECAPRWKTDPGVSPGEALEKDGRLTPGLREALLGRALEMLERAGGDESAAISTFRLADEVIRALRDLLGMERRASPGARGDGEDDAEEGLQATTGDTVMEGGGAEGRAMLAKLREGPPDRYEFGEEIGRGGVGKVMEAEDKDLERAVAVKMMLPEAVSPAAAARFLFEARAAGRLTHPNIIPVYEIGVFSGGGVRTPYFTMARIAGRDLRKILKEIRGGNAETMARHTRTGLLQIFLDVCHAVSFAHDRGVLHRDLKPGNVMVGDYGEVYVVDWGLAKVTGEPDSSDPSDRTAPAERAESRDDTSATERELLGTPAYMSPEQADGRVADVDEKSDIYCLGAILYEILALTPPFRGETVFNVIAKVLAGSPEPPSARLKGLQARMEAPPLSPVPPELDEICLRAMAYRKEDRYASARELGDEVRRHLEGEQERERSRRKAAAKIEEGRALLAELRERNARLQKLEAKVRKEAAQRPSWLPAERKRDLWCLEDEIEALRDERVRTFTRAGRAFQAALEFDRECAEARAALADMYWERFLAEEEGGDRHETIVYRELVQEFNDGRYEARLQGNGTLSVSTLAFPCPCLRSGLEVDPGERDVLGRDPLADPGGGAVAPPGSARAPLRLRAHGPDCRAEPRPGADAWLFRFEERDRLLVPVLPKDAALQGHGAGGTGHEARPEDSSRAVRMPLAPSPVPPGILDRLYEPSSPFRPGEGLYLGKTPVKPLPLPMGSYLLVLAADGCAPLRVPVRIGRMGRERVEATLYREGEIPPGFVQVAGGRFPSGGDRKNPYTTERRTRDAAEFFLARHPVTCSEYLAFLDDLASRDPDEARRRSPRRSPAGGWYWPFVADSAEGGTALGRHGEGEPPGEPPGGRRRGQDRDIAAPSTGRGGRFVIPTEKWMAEAPEASRREAAKLEMSPVWWEEDWPVFGVSWGDLTAFAVWKTRREGFVFSLPGAWIWEKAARGADGRTFPWGDRIDGSFCNTKDSHEHGIRPAPVGEFPADESPYGVRGMGGNVREACLEPHPDFAEFRLWRGGAWPAADVIARCTGMAGFPRESVNYYGGGRLALYPRLPYA